MTVVDIDATQDRTITVEVYGDGMLAGGMIYRLDPKLRRRLDLTTHRVKDVVVKKMSLDLVIDECED
ncbi:MAG: hypothetical protein QOG34_1543 [Frankiaceae bacterium]|nr:hypothetical protein [Frankiaceae bacterium]